MVTVAAKQLRGVVSHGKKMERRNLQDVRQLFQTWDKGSKAERECILIDFVRECESMTGPDIDTHFCDCSSLFLARITSWLRITYMFGTCLKLQLQALNIFVSASTNYLMEFLEVGGVLTLLEIVNLKSCTEEDKAESLRLITLVANKGRQYKEIICESYGIKVIAECLANSQTQEVHECSQNLLYQLSMGNPRYQAMVYKTAIKLLSSSSHNAQRLAAYTLRAIQPSVGAVDSSIVEPLLQLFKSLHSDVQHEADLLIVEVMKHPDIHQSLLLGLVNLLKPEVVSKAKTTAEPLGAHLQQAGAARILCTFVHDKTIGSKMIELNVIPHLLFALSNSSFPDSQRQALKCLQLFMKHYVTINELVQLLVGDCLFQKLQVSPASISDSLSLDDIDRLVSCLVNHHKETIVPP